MLAALMPELHNADVRRLAWAMGSPTLFNADDPAWLGRLRTDLWSSKELARCTDWLLAIDRDPSTLQQALGDPMVNTPLGHTFEKFVLFWQAARPDVRVATRGLMVRTAGRTIGEFDVVLLRHDGVIETLEVTVKYFLNIHPELGMAGCYGPRAYDRMTEKYSKMTTRQTDLGHTDAGRQAISRWLETTCGELRSPDALSVENFALSRGYLFHPSTDAVAPIELSPEHGRGLWQTDAQALPDAAPGLWRNLSSREWLGSYCGPAAESGWPNDPAMPRMYARLSPSTRGHESWTELERRFVVRAESGLLKAV
jgi:uncharacterized protein